MRIAFHTLLLLALVFCLHAHGAEAGKKKVLFLFQSKGFQHETVKKTAQYPNSLAGHILTEIGQKSGVFDVECTDDGSVITPEKLKDLDLLFFYTTGPLPVRENFPAIQEWIKSGKGFCGTHSATDTLGDFKPYFELIGGTFAGHPWGDGSKITVTNHDPQHPVVKMFEAEFTHKDEIYVFKNYDPKSVRVLMSLNMIKTEKKEKMYVPLTWVKEYGQGRVFYTSLGHGIPVWKDAKYQEHLLGGIKWALKLEQGSATPNPELQAAETAKSMLAATIGRPDRKPAEIIPALQKLAETDKPSAEAIIAELKKQSEELDKQKKDIEEILQKAGK